jgi:hypothetical protein
MSFEEFQNSARLYVIGALEPDELQEFEGARKQYGAAAEEFINQCYTLHEAFALSLKAIRYQISRSLATVTLTGPSSRAK